MHDSPFIVAICPTFNHPELLANSVALWEQQDYPAERRFLLILDDGGAFDAQEGDRWRLIALPARARSLADKYSELAWWAFDSGADAALVWEDDDLYAPGYVSAHARVLASAEYSKPALVLSDYPGYLVEEAAAGRFHSTLGFRRQLWHRIGRQWPPSKRADFDQQMIRQLEAHAASRGDPFAASAGQPGKIEFVYRWHTGAHHGQSFMRSADDESWYDRAGESRPPYVGRLEPQLDQRTRELLAEASSKFQVPSSRF